VTFNGFLCISDPPENGAPAHIISALRHSSFCFRFSVFEFSHKWTRTRALPTIRDMPEAMTDHSWRGLYGTGSKLANNLARLAYGARSSGLGATIRQMMRRVRRSGGKSAAAPAAAPPADIGDTCSWIDTLPGIDRTQRSIAPGELAAFMRDTNYPSHYYRTERRVRYALWHYVGLQLANLSERDVVLDAGAQDGIWGRIARRRHQCTVYDADLQYRPGVHGHQVGCEVGSIPLPDGSLTAIVSFCAFNCFEGDADQAFLKEAVRLLQPGGRLVIVPLCIGDTYVNLYDPAVMNRPENLDAGARHIPWTGWGSNFGRWYDRDAFERRFLNNVAGSAARIEQVKPGQPADAGVRDFYAAVCTKAAT